MQIVLTSLAMELVSDAVVRNSSHVPCYDATRSPLTAGTYSEYNITTTSFVSDVCDSTSLYATFQRNKKVCDDESPYDDDYNAARASNSTRYSNYCLMANRAPSSTPTADPTTIAPTTISPSANPSTAIPTNSPTSSPTTDPSTVAPSNFPTSDPTTIAPTTTSPSTISPSANPSTAIPSTLSPSCDPSFAPTASPSTVPVGTDGYVYLQFYTASDCGGSKSIVSGSLANYCYNTGSYYRKFMFTEGR